MKRPASPGPEDPRPDGSSGAPRRRAGRGRRWIPENHRPAVPPPPVPPPDRAHRRPPPEPPRPSWSPVRGEHHPWDDKDATHWLPHHTPHQGGARPPDPETEPTATPGPASGPAGPGSPRYPRKITVTRVAAFRSRKLVGDGVRLFHRATTADGAGRSGLSSLTYATMMDFAANAAIAVALANTLFFAAATAESRTNVALYLLITVAPFAVVAPVIGPLLDRLQHGRRVTMAASFAGRALLLVVMAMHIDDWLLYPAALGFMVLSKSYGVLKAAVTPRVLPPEITLVKTNSRLTVFGMIAGGVAGGIAAGVAALSGSPGALWFTVAVCVAGAALCLRIPSWVEVTEGEVPASLRGEEAGEPARARRRQPMGRRVAVALWGNGTARLLTGFLTLFVAFVVKAQTEGSPGRQVLMLGAVGAAAGAGSFLGNAVGARMHFGKPDRAILGCVGAGLTMAVLTAVVEGIVVASVTALVAATCSALAKVCLDAVIQREMPERSRASAFGRSETVLQVAWVLGGALGVLLPPAYWIGFGSVSLLLGLGLAQTILARRGSSLIPGLGGTHSPHPAPAMAARAAHPPQPPQHPEYPGDPDYPATREYTTVHDPAGRFRRGDGS